MFRLTPDVGMVIGYFPMVVHADIISSDGQIDHDEICIWGSWLEH